MNEVTTDAPQLAHSVRVGGDGTVEVHLGGELDVATAPDLDVEVVAALGPGTSRLLLEISELDFADSFGIALWVGWSRRVPRVELRGAQVVMRRVVETMGLADTLHLV